MKGYKLQKIHTDKVEFLGSHNVLQIFDVKV